jgi:cytoskeletal protein CcmA (bactofilin family)
VYEGGAVRDAGRPLEFTPTGDRGVMQFRNQNVEKSGAKEPIMPMPQPTPERQDATPVPPRREEPAVPSAPSDLLLGRGARFEGKLTFEGTVRIDATFIGSIVTNDVLVVGEAARIDADITCGTIIVHGEVNGNIQAKTGVEVHRTGKVRGDLETPSLLIERGALFQGATRMEPGAKLATAKAAGAK